MSPIDPTITLADGNQIPVLALGVWQAKDGAETENAVRWALEAGYRHIDTAQAYGNEESVGRGIRASGVPRDEIYVTTKFYPESKDPAAEAERSLDRLGLDYVDLYIIHWPAGGPTWAWPGMETAKDKGFARSIGERACLPRTGLAFPRPRRSRSSRECARECGSSGPGTGRTG